MIFAWNILSTATIKHHLKKILYANIIVHTTQYTILVLSIIELNKELLFVSSYIYFEFVVLFLLLFIPDDKILML